MVGGIVPQRAGAAPAKVILLPERPEGTAIRDEVSRRYEEASAMSDIDGHPVVRKERVRPEPDDIALTVGGSGVRIIIRSFAASGKECADPAGKLLDVSLSERPDIAFRVVARSHPYTDKHLVLARPEWPQRMCLDGLTAGLRFLKAVGYPWSGFFNAAAPTTRSFHFQIFGESLPLWQNLERGCVRTTTEPSVSASCISVRTLLHWLFPARLFHGESPDAVAVTVWEAIQEAQAAEASIVVDVVFACARDGSLLVVPVPRDVVIANQAPQSFYPENSSLYGTFGGLELSGLIPVKRDAKLRNFFSGTGLEPVRRILRSLEETTSTASSQDARVLYLGTSGTAA